MISDGKRLHMSGETRGQTTSGRTQTGASKRVCGRRRSPVGAETYLTINNTLWFIQGSQRHQSHSPVDSIAFAPFLAVIHLPKRSAPAAHLQSVYGSELGVDIMVKKPL